MNKYWKNQNKVRLTTEEAQRQGKAARLAWETFPESGTAIAFLNTFNEQLGGRPIDLAVASDRGLQAVEAELATAQRSG